MVCVDHQPGHTLAVKGAELAYQDRRVLKDLTLMIPEGRITVILGPNGSGKSTLLHALARILRPQAGSVLLDGTDIHQYPTDAVARLLALLPQAPHAPEGLRVRDLVAFGRFPYRGWFDSASEEDDRQIEEALHAVGITHLSDRGVQTLSGGQRQRAWIAMALAQQTHFLLLDEPTTYLDIAHQLEVMELIQQLNQKTGKTMVMVLHDLNLAARYADYLVVLHRQGIAAMGDPIDVLTCELLQDVFAIRASVTHDSHSGAPICIPLGPISRGRETMANPTRETQ